MDTTSDDRLQTPYSRWNTIEHPHWQIHNQELSALDWDEKDDVDRSMDVFQEHCTQSDLQRACADFELEKCFVDYGVLLKGGDVLISLSASDEDTVIVPSEVLTNASQYFATALDEKWVHNKTMQTSNGLVIKRFELEYSSNYNNLLVGKTKPTPPSKRDLQESFMSWAEHKYIDERTLLQNLRCPWDFSQWEDEDLSWESDADRSATIIANKLGLSIICHFPIKSDDEHRLWYEMPGFATLVVLKLLQWFSTYLIPFQTIKAQVVGFIFTCGPRWEIDMCPWTYLRIAYLLQSWTLIIATVHASSWNFHFPSGFNSVDGDAKLNRWIGEVRDNVLNKCRELERELLVIKAKSSDHKTMLACRIWISWLHGSSHSGAGFGEYMFFANFASGDTKAADILQWWRSYKNEPSRPDLQLENRSAEFSVLSGLRTKAAAIYSAIFDEEAEGEDPETLVIMEDIIEEAMIGVRKIFSKFELHPANGAKVAGYHAMDLNEQIFLRQYPTPARPWDDHPDPLFQSETVLSHLLETAEYQYGAEDGTESSIAEDDKRCPGLEDTWGSW